MKNLIFFILLSSCEAPTGDDLVGSVVSVEVTTQLDTCQPARFLGDAGVQFIATRDNGEVVFTVSQQAQFGPAADGVVLPGLRRLALGSPDGGSTQLGTNEHCTGAFANWSRTPDGLRLTQEWPGIDLCPEGPAWFPQKRCESIRRFVMTEVGTCPLRCVKILDAAEIECSC